MNKFIYEILFNDDRNKYYNPNEVFNDNEIKSLNNNNQKEMFNLVEGFENGNMFKDLYEPYKNYKPETLKPKNEEQEILLKIDQLGFAMHEINLFLNVYPNDESMIKNYNLLQREYDKLLKYYESKFTPLQRNNQYMNNSPFSWTEDPWPWDRRIL